MKFLVIGCGYFGSRAAKLWQNLGHDVFVTTRSKQKAELFAEQGLHPAVVDITVPDTLAALPVADVVLFAVGFDRSGDDDIREVYVNGLENVLDHLPSPPRHLVYVSSTGVLSSSDGEWVDETAATEPSRDGGKAHLQAERILLNSDYKTRTTILRLAGIYGPDRVPRLSAVLKKQWSRLPSRGHVNLIHVQDAAGVAHAIVEKQLTSQIYHVADGHPPLRRKLYEFVAAETGVGTIDWSQTTDAMVALRSSSDKKVSNQKLRDDTQYQFQYPDFHSGVRAALAETDLSQFA